MGCKNNLINRVVYPEGVFIPKNEKKIIKLILDESRQNMSPSFVWKNLNTYMYDIYYYKSTKTANIKSTNIFPLHHKPHTKWKWIVKAYRNSKETNQATNPHSDQSIFVCQYILQYSMFFF